MLRISNDDSRNGEVNLRLEGEIAGPWVDETSRVCEAALKKCQNLRLDLAEVVFVDRAGIELLIRLRKGKAVFAHCSRFLAAALECRDRLAA